MTDGLMEPRTNTLKNVSGLLAFIAWGLVFLIPVIGILLLLMKNSQPGHHQKAGAGK